MEIRLRDYWWGGMLSMWGQQGRVWQGVCYSAFNDMPSEFVEVGHDAPPVEKYFVRFVSLDSAQFWLDYLLKNIIPEARQELFKITRVHSKANWPENFEVTIDKGEILDTWDVLPEERAQFLAARIGSYAGTVPWLKVEFSQELSALEIFSIGVFFRYASEHGACIEALRALQVMIPEMPQQDLLYVAQHISGTRGHAVGDTGYLPGKGLKKFLADNKWKTAWNGMAKKQQPFHVEPCKTDAVNNFFPSCRRNGVYYYSGHLGMDSYSRNEVTLFTEHSQSATILDLLVKDYA